MKEDLLLDLIISLQLSFEHAPKFAGFFKKWPKSELQIFPCAKLNQIGQKRGALLLTLTDIQNNMMTPYSRRSVTSSNYLSFWIDFVPEHNPAEFGGN